MKVKIKILRASVAGIAAKIGCFAKRLHAPSAPSPTYNSVAFRYIWMTWLLTESRTHGQIMPF